jgi:hypothetical protein
MTTQVRVALVLGLEATCQFLDGLPRWQRGEWVEGRYGCRWLRLSWFAWRLDNRWHTGVWVTQEQPRSQRGE